MFTGAVNQRSPQPETRMPKSVPLRAMTVTSVEPATPPAGSTIDFPAAIARFRKNWSLPARNSARRATAWWRPPTFAIPGIIARVSSAVAARLRWCISSAMRSACAISARRSMPPSARSPAPSSGPASVAIQLRRASTLSSLAPYRSTLPSPSLIVAWPRVPWARFSTTNTGIEGVTTPAIGPAVAWWWQGSSRTAPRSTSSRAASSLAAQPS